MKTDKKYFIIFHAITIFYFLRNGCKRLTIRNHNRVIELTMNWTILNKKFVITFNN